MMERKEVLEKMYLKVSAQAETSATFSAFMRQLRKERPQDVPKFLTAFKQAFDEASQQNLEDIEQVALLEAMHAIGSTSQS